VATGTDRTPGTAASYGGARRAGLGRSGSPNSPRDNIIASATELFATQGYSETTMRDIANATGLHQSSLYYWFRGKEDILQIAFDLNRAPLDFISSVAILPGSPGLKLYRFVRFDTYQVSTAACDPMEVERAAERQPDLFDEFWRDRQRLHDVIVTLVRSGIEEEDFVECDAELAALLIVSVDEGIEKRIRYQTKHAPDSGHAFSHPGYDPKVVAEFVASTSVRALLRRAADIKRITRAASRYDDLPYAPGAQVLRH
jgi:TetR/AcrR family transcriptional regulator